MRKHLLLIAFIISLFVFNTAKAQDSTHYDLGRIQANKNFTQSITIKASDLERYQFNYITDALKVFFYGTFTNSTSVVYVIDGNIVNDVNAYSIQDVEEITLVQSAFGQVSGASPSQQMVLIKTRRGGPGKQGVTVSDQTSLVNARNNNNYSNANKPTGLYEQAYLGAYKNYTTADIGASVGFLHSVSPEDLSSDFTAFNPFHYDQFRLNAYADAKLWHGTTLNFGANYTPEVANQSYAASAAYPNGETLLDGMSHESQHLLNANIALRSHIAGGLTNTLSAGYNHYNDFEQGATLNSVTNQGFGSSTYSTQMWQRHAHTLLFKDNLAYHQQIGEWSVDPSVSFMYRHVNDTLSLIETAHQDSVPLNNFTSGMSQKADYSLSLLTPSVDIYYKNIFDIQGGFTDILNKEYLGPVLTVDHLLPFVSASLNISEMAGLQSVQLRVFASFSRQNEFLNDPYVSLQAFTLQGFENVAGTYSATANPILPSAFNTFQSYNNYQAGFMLGLWKNFSLTYNFRENYYWILAEYTVPVGGNGSELEDVFQNARAATHSIALNYVVRSGNLNWTTGLTATTSKLQLTGQAQANLANSYLASGHRWTGGFNNRFTYKELFAGVDLLYQLGQRPYGLESWQPIYPGYIPPASANSFSLQDFYIGTRIKVEHLKYAEIYLNTRNILQNKSSDITDERRFYGVGFKLNF